MSYIGLDSYLVAENWNYTRSLASDHTPFYFQGIRAQIFPTASIKIEPWLMNGWQSYGKYNFSPSGGLAFRFQPVEALGLFANFYFGTDTPGQADRVRFHHDNSVVWRLWQNVESPITRVALSLNVHVGFESGGAGLPGPDRAHFLASTLAVRTWFANDLFAFTGRGEIIKNGTSYLRQFAPPDLAPDVNLVVWGLTAPLNSCRVTTSRCGLRSCGVNRTNATLQGPAARLRQAAFKGAPLRTGYLTPSSRRRCSCLRPTFDCSRGCSRWSCCHDEGARNPGSA